MKKRFVEAQSVPILKEAKDGMSTWDVSSKHKVSEQTFYCCKAKHADMLVSDE